MSLMEKKKPCHCELLTVGIKPKKMLGHLNIFPHPKPITYLEKDASTNINRYLRKVILNLIYLLECV